MNKGLVVRLAIVALIIAAFAVFFGMGLNQELSFENLGRLQGRFGAYFQENPLLLLGGYFGVYILVTAFSLPGAAIMTLAGGAMFGFWPALVTVSFASSIGATLACFFARYVLGQWVQKKFGDKIRPINEGIKRDGAFYLFSLRLVPAFPFFIINLIMGLTPIRLVTFYWVSQIGMLAGTTVYVNAGTQLGKIKSPGDILSPELIISFVILGAFPLLVKLIMNYVQKKRQAQLPG
ncbi:MAG: TVP38/TMEM64 family protein [Desulfarculaceae bacterium]|jgi:uncharacterized membrane protein YdjX (TVP38/TMEM64 family)